MKRNNEIWQELKDLQSPLADMPWHMAYAVPDDYFSRLSGTLTQGVIDSESEDRRLPYLKSLPFDVPQGYFHTLPERLAQSAIQDADAGKSVRFEVPDDYFENLPQTLLRAVKDAEKPTTTVVAFRPLWQKKAVQWAVAAMLVVGIGMGTFTYMHSSTPDARAAKQLAKLDKDVISHYVSLHVDEFDSEMLESMAASGVNFDKSISNLNEEEILDYLEGAGPADTPTMN